MTEHDIMLWTLWGVAFGFLLKGLVFGSASGIMIYQKGTSKLANAVKWFFIVMTIQDIIFAVLYGAGAYEAMDDRTQALNTFWRNVTRVSGLIAIFSVAVVGAYFIWVLSKRVRVLIEYEEVNGEMQPVRQNKLARRSSTQYEGEDDQ